MTNDAFKIVYDQLEGKFYLVRKDYDFSLSSCNVDFLQHGNQNNNNSHGFSNLTLVLTSKCNLACDYCWQVDSNVMSDSSDMSIDTIEHWLSYFLNKEDKANKKIVYYGGEPLLRIDLIKFTTDTVKRITSEKNLPYPKQHIFTNGTLLSKPIVNLFRQENIFPIISIDGNEEITSKHRKTLSGKSLWEKTIRGIELLKNERIDFGIACTIEQPEFDFENIALFLVEQIKPKTIEFNLRHDKAMVVQYKHNPTPDFSNFCKAWDLSLDRGIRVVDLSKRVKPYVEQTPLRNSSSGCKNKLAIMPDGKISPFNGAVSFSELQFLPDDEEGKKFFNKIWEREVRTQTKCSSCEAIFICGQGSAFTSYLQFNEFNKTPVYHCEYSKYIFSYIKKRLLDLIDYGDIDKYRQIEPEDIKKTFNL
jgi:radical SAM protein with 4Fe4S-binding SPASM domain